MYCFSPFCRLCFRRDCKLINLHIKDDDMVTFNEKLKSCIPEIVCDEDRMPNFICDNCCNKLRKGYEFKTMCVKNHLALRDYAKQLLKYMENPLNNHGILNMKLVASETESVSDYKENKTDSECSEDEQDLNKTDSQDSTEEPLALVKTVRVPSPYNPYLPSNSLSNNIKMETESDDDSEYQCEDLSKKSTEAYVKEENSFVERIEKDRLPQTYGKDMAGCNMTNDMVMKYLKLEFQEREENNRSNDTVQTNDHPENLCTADSEIDEREENCSIYKAQTSDDTRKMKTRTKDKYRIVYTENQRLELEKEFIVSRYITTSRKMQLSASLNLSQRQIKIWFQNRRAKERKQVKRSAEQYPDGSTDPCTTSCDTPTSLEHSMQKVTPQINQELFLLHRSTDYLIKKGDIEKASTN